MGILNLKTLTVNFGDLRMTRDDRLRPEHEHEQGITKEFNRWWRGEYTRVGAAPVSTNPPPEVQEAIDKVRQRRAEKSRAFFESVDPRIKADRAQRVESIVAHMTALAAELPALAAFETELRKFARECGEYRPRPQNTDALTHALLEWMEIERQRTATRPTPPKYQPPSTNPLNVPAMPEHEGVTV